MAEARIDGIVVWRTGLLLGGPLVHSVGGWYSAQPVVPLDMIVLGSHLFRVAAFFTIAGFLAASSQARSGWLEGRLRQLLVPLFAVSIIMVDTSFGLFKLGLADVLYWSVVPGHLWFLISLAIISPVMLWVDRLGWHPAIMVSTERHPRIALLAAFLATLTVGTTSALLGWLWLHKVGIYPELAAILLVKTPTNLCFYVLGFHVARSAACRERLRSTRWWWIGLPMWGCAMLFYYRYAGDTLVPDVNRGLKLLALLLMTASQFLMCVTMLATALRIGRVHDWVRHVSQSAYTIYLLHMPFILIITAVARKLDPAIDPYALYALLVFGSLLLSYAAHRTLIAGSSILLFLLNGAALPVRPNVPWPAWFAPLRRRFG